MKNFFKNLFGAKPERQFETEPVSAKATTISEDRLVYTDYNEAKSTDVPTPKGIIENHFDVTETKRRKGSGAVSFTDEYLVAGTNGKNEVLVFDKMKTTRKKKEGLSPTQIRLIKFLLGGKTLSIKTMWEVRISNPSREVGRCIREPFGILLNVKRVDWRDELSNGYYFEYRLDKKDYGKLLDIANENNIKL